MTSVWEYRELLWQGAAVTLQLALAAVLLAACLGLVFAYMRVYGGPLQRLAAGIYATLVRGVPDLVLMMLLFYGGQQLLNDVGSASGWWDYIEVGQFGAGVMALGFVSGAYMSETFRGAILAVPRGQRDAGLAIGMSPARVFMRIVLPQMARHALPGFSNNWQVLLKATALVSVIGLHDLVWNATTAGRSVREPFSFMFAVFIVYLLFTAVSDGLLRRLRVRLDRGQVKS